MLLNSRFSSLDLVNDVFEMLSSLFQPLKSLNFNIFMSRTSYRLSFLRSTILGAMSYGLFYVVYDEMLLQKYPAMVCGMVSAGIERKLMK